MLKIIYFLVLFSVVFGDENFCFKTITTNLIDAAESYFGYSVQLRIDQYGNGRVIVGAPRATSLYEEHTDVKEPGVVFLCNINDSECKQYILDNQGNTHFKQPGYMHYKNEGWLGAVIDGDESLHGTLVACAPKWINQFYADIQKYDKPYILNGLCYMLNDASDVNKIADIIYPLQNPNLTFIKKSYGYAYGEAGFSLNYIKDTELIMGAPGVMDWQGTVANYKYPFSEETLVVINREDRFNKNKLITSEEKYSYFGYSVASGKFLKSNKKRWYVSGAPRGSYLKGEVYVYDLINNHLDVKYKLNGTEIGEYFGYSLIVTDINNDGIDEIIVGAPIYSYRNEKTDSGRIYLFTSNGEGKFQEGEILNQYSEKNARIGTAVSAVGDLNKDGYNDIVIGAPYGYDRRGFIIICYGFDNGLKCNQPIFSTSVSIDLRGFGMSISKGVDIDKNGINDFVVGSALSGHVVLFQSRSKIHVSSRFSSTPTQYTMNTNKIILTSCLAYTGENVPTSLVLKRSIKFNDDRIDFDEKQFRSVKFWNTKVTLDKDIENCRDIILNVKNNHSDLIKPLTLILTYGTDSQDQSGCNPYYQKTEKLEIDYVIGCKDENNCQSDLVVSGKYNWDKPSFILGEYNNIQLFAYVENIGDPAFNCRLYVTLPDYVSFYKMSDRCTDFQETENLHCFNVGRHLYKNEKKKIILHLKLDTNEMPMSDKLIVKLNATSNDKEKNNFNNVEDVVLPLGIDETIEFTSHSIPDTLSSTQRDKSLKFITKINNMGPSPIDNFKIEIFVPVTVNKIKILKLQQLNAVIKSFRSDTKEILSCVDEGITSLLPLLNVPKMNETTDTTHLYITEHTEDLNVDYRKYICNINKRFQVNDQINIKLPANVEIDKFNKIDDYKSLIYLYTYVIAYKSGRETEDNVVVTKIVIIQEASLSAWIGGGIGFGLLFFIIIALILYKYGCFNRKNKEWIQAQKLSKMNISEDKQFEDDDEE